MKYDVFISYSRKDYIDFETKNVIPNNVISKIKEAFIENSITFWIDEDGVYSGDAFAPVITENIRSSKIFLFISSENSNISEWTSNEIAVAHMYKKKIIPFRIDNSVYNDSIIMYVARLDYIDYKVNPKRAIGRMVESITKVLRDSQAEEERRLAEVEAKRQEEISRKERAEKLQLVQHRIVDLKERRLSIEKDIISYETIIAELRTEIRSVDANLRELQLEETMLMGRKSSDPLKNAEKGKHQIMEEFTSKPKKKSAIIFSSKGLIHKIMRCFSRERENLKNGMCSRHWLVNLFLLGSLLFASIFLVCLSLNMEIFDDYYRVDQLFTLLLSFWTVISLYRLLKSNNVFALLSIPFIIMLALLPPYYDFNYGYIYRGGTILFSFSWVICCVTLFFIKKNGLTVWKCLKRPHGTLRAFWGDISNIIIVSISAILLTIFLWSWAYYTKESNSNEREYFRYISIFNENEEIFKNNDEVVLYIREYYEKCRYAFPFSSGDKSNVYESHLEFQAERTNREKRNDINRIVAILNTYSSIENLKFESDKIKIDSGAELGPYHYKVLYEDINTYNFEALERKWAPQLNDTCSIFKEFIEQILDYKHISKNGSIYATDGVITAKRYIQTLSMDDNFDPASIPYETHYDILLKLYNKMGHRDIDKDRFEHEMIGLYRKYAYVKINHYRFNILLDYLTRRGLIVYNDSLCKIAISKIKKQKNI